MAEQQQPPPDSGLARSKQRWAQQGRFLSGKTTRPAAERLPPGQHLRRNWPTPDRGLAPEMPRWRLYGAIEHPLLWNFTARLARKQTQFASDVHCATTWSRYDNQRVGLAAGEQPHACRPHQRARFAVLRGYDGYTTSLALEDFAAADALLAHSSPGAPLAVGQGGSMHLVVPHLPFWKNAKRLQAIEFLEHDAPGSWEVRGFHNYGDPQTEQRYSVH